MEIIVGLALLILLWLVWQLIKAKNFTRFKQLINDDLKPKVIESIINKLDETRSDIFPNTDIHQQATIDFWCQYKARILYAALHHDIIDKAWLKETGNLKNCQHLFHVEQQFLPHIKD